MKYEEIKVLDNGTFQRAKGEADNVAYEVRLCSSPKVMAETISVMITSPDSTFIEGKFSVNSFINVLSELLDKLTTNTSKRAITVECRKCQRECLVAPGVVFPKCHGEHMRGKEVVEN